MGVFVCYLYIHYIQYIFHSFILLCITLILLETFCCNPSKKKTVEPSQRQLPRDNWLAYVAVTTKRPVLTSASKLWATKKQKRNGTIGSQNQLHFWSKPRPNNNKTSVFFKFRSTKLCNHKNSTIVFCTKTWCLCESQVLPWKKAQGLHFPAKCPREPMDGSSAVPGAGSEGGSSTGGWPCSSCFHSERKRLRIHNM